MNRFEADPKGLTYQMYLFVLANTWEEVVEQMQQAEVDNVFEGVVHYEDGQEEGECGMWVIAVQADDVDLHMADAERLSDRFVNLPHPDLPIRDIEELF